MAYIFSDGFTAYQFHGDLDSTYTREGDSTNLRILTDGGPGDNGSIRLGGVDLSEAGFYREFSSYLTTGFIGFWFTLHDFDTSEEIDEMIMSLRSGTSARVSMRISSDGSIQMVQYTNSTELFDSSDATETHDGLQHYLSKGVAYKIELKVVGINTNGYIELRVNDEIWGIVDPADCNGTYNRLYFKTGESGNGADFEISDLYVLDDQGTVYDNNNFLGSGWQIEVIRPDAESASIAFTPKSGTDNSAMVDDAPQANLDADYNDSSADAQVDRFTSTDTLVGRRIHNVNVINVARHTGTAQNFRAVIYEGATAGNGTDTALSASFQIFMEPFETNPDTSSAWTDTEVEAAEFGYESRT